MEKNQITVLLIEPEARPKVVTMETGLKPLQEAVGGYIEAVYPFDDPVALIVNEEGKLDVVQIIENDYWGADHTFCILEDSSYNVYYVNMYGFANNIYEGSRVTLTALPLDYFTYPNVAGEEVWAIACAGVIIK